MRASTVPVSARLLGRHVARRADREPGGHRRPVAQLGQPEVEDAQMLLEPRLGAQDQVLRLEIAVNDPLRVRVRQAGQQLLGDLEDARERDRPLQHRLAQRPAGDEVHHQVGRPLDAEVDHRHAVGVREAAHRLGLVLEAAEERLLRGDPGVQELHRHRPSQLNALALVDDAHRAGGDLGQDPVPALQHVADARVGRRRGFGVHRSASVSRRPRRETDGGTPTNVATARAPTVPCE